MKTYTDSTKAVVNPIEIHFIDPYVMLKRIGIEILFDATTEETLIINKAIPEGEEKGMIFSKDDWNKLLVSLVDVP